MEPVRPEKSCGVCVVDEADGLTMETAEGEKEKVYKGIEVEKIGKEGDKRDMRKLVDPRKPTEEEVSEHELTHLPYRNWCPVCVMAKGKELDHRRSVEEHRGLSEYSFDYCFPGDEFGYKLTVLVGTERLTGMTFGTAVPTKGSSGKFAVGRALDFIAEVGDMDGQIILKMIRSQASNIS